MDIIKFIESIKWVTVLNIIFTLVFYVFALKFTKGFTTHAFLRLKKKAKDIESEKNYETLRVVVQSALNFIISVFVFINILNHLGVDVRPIITAAGVLGVAVGFGSKKFVEDFLSGLTILLEGQVRVGDVVEVQNITGTVEKITLSLIIIRSVDGALHYIRNGMVDIVTNYTRDFSYAFMDITVAYKENIAQVMEVIKNLGDEFIQMPEFKDKIIGNIEILGLDSFEASSVKILYRLRTIPRVQWEVKRAFNLKIKEKFDELGIEIPFDQHVVTKAN